MLVEYGSLADTIKELQSRINELQKETSVLEGQRRLKEEIEHNIARLKAEKVSLEKSVTYLAKEKETFAQLQKDAKALNDNKIVLEQDIIVMEKHKQDLSGEIEALEKKTFDLKELEVKHHSLSADIAEMEVRINSSQTQLDVLQSFLGFIEPSSFAQIDNFASQLPHLLADVRQENYSPELLRNYILETLSGGTLRTLMCTVCNTRFTVDKPSKYSLGYYCPVCFGSLIKVVQDEVTILKAALPKEQPKQWVLRRRDC